MVSERARLALAILTLDGANLLLLDEPTNHLDIPAQEALQAALEDFAGTILLVSHDRYLIDRLATQIWVLDNGELQIFKGGYQAYLAHKMANSLEEKDEAGQQVTEMPAVSSPNGTPQLSKNAQRQRNHTIQRLEKRIYDTEIIMEQISTAIQNATQEGDFDKIQQLGIEYAEMSTQLEAFVAEWEDFLSE